MITADGTPKILDFGLASITRMSEETEFVTRPNAGISGTPAYLTPEQLLGKPADHRSDQFALGTVLYQCVKGVNPFLRETAPSTFAAILESSPPRDTGPKGLAAVIHRCLEKNPARRYQQT